MPVISVTRLRVRSWYFLPGFLMAALRIGRQAKKAPGNLAVKVLQDKRKTFWTCTAWDSQESMRAFMVGPPHGPAMRRLLEWCDEAALVHWTQPGPELPGWSEAHQRMQREGRTSKVNHPSEDQRRFFIPPPPAHPRSQMRLK
jgi:hypothetical protein